MACNGEGGPAALVCGRMLELDADQVETDRLLTQGDKGPKDELRRLRHLMEDHARRLRELEDQVCGRSTGLNDGDLPKASGPPCKTLTAGGERSSGASKGAPSGRNNGSMERGKSAVVAPTDPFNDMWSAAKLQQTRIFDQNLLNSIYNKQSKDYAQQMALVGSGIIGLLAMPFGPIGMVAGGVVGAILGGMIGFCADKRRMRKQLKEHELQRRRLRSLVRWASERVNDEDEVKQLIEMVTLEFRPFADCAQESKTARKQLKLLESWVAQKFVTRQLWVYMDDLLQHWQDLSRGEFIRAMLVLQTLAVMYKHSNRILGDQEEQFVQRVERLLDHSSVKNVMAHAHMFPLQGDSRAKECMVFADHTRLQRQRSIEPPSKDKKSQESGDDKAGLMGLRSDDSDDEPLADTGPDKVGEANVESDDVALPLGVPRKVLKKPFFKSFEDFMDFDIELKRKMPITLSEFNLLLEKEAESTAPPWDVCVDRKEIRVAKMQMGGGCVTLRAWATIPGIDIHAAFYLFHKHSERVQWDKVFANMELIGEPQCGSDLLYSLLRIPGVTSRDFLQYRRVKMLEDGSIAIVLRSAEHPDCPETRGNIRAESYIGGYVLRQEFDGETPVLKLFIMSCSDVKGLIPKWIINMVAPKKPGEWVDVLKKACVGYQEANKNYKAEARAYADKFAECETPWDYEAEPGSPENYDGDLLSPISDSDDLGFGRRIQL